MDTAERQRLLGRVYAVLMDLARQKKAATGAEPCRAIQSVTRRDGFSRRMIHMGYVDGVDVGVQSTADGQV